METAQVIVPLKDAEYGAAQYHNKVPIYPIFYLLKGVYVPQS